MFNTSRGQRALLGSCLISLSVGFNTVWGSILPYFTNFFRYNGYPTLTDTQLNIVGPITALATFIGQNTSITLCNKVGSRRAMYYALCIFSLSLLMASLTTNLIFFVCTYAVFFFFAIGLFYMAPISICMQYFPNNKGLVTGTVLCFYGVSGVIIQQVFVLMINPDNLIPRMEGNQSIYPKEMIQNLPDILKILLVSSSSVIFFGAYFIKNIKQIKPANTEIVSNFTEKNILQQNKETCTSVKDAFHSQVFYYLFVLYFCQQFFSWCVIYNFKVIGLQTIRDDQFLSLTIGNISCFLFGGIRPFAGILYDQFSFRKCMSVIIVLQIILEFTFMQAAQHRVSYAIAVCSTFTLQAASCTIFPPFCVSVFGVKHGTDICARILLAQTLSQFSQQFFVQLFQESIGFQNIFRIISVLSFASLIMINTVDPIYKSNKQSLLNILNNSSSSESDTIKK